MNMKYIKFFENYENENNITVDNFLDYKDSIYAAIAGQDKLIKGYKFTVNNIDDYHQDEFVSQLVDSFLNDLNQYLNQYYPNFFKETSDSGYSGHKVTGSVYKQTKDMDLKEIAKLIRKELKAEFPDFKFKVTISRFAGGESLRVEINDMPFNPFSEEFQEFLHSNKPIIEWNRSSNDNKFNEKTKEVLDHVKKIVNQYNYDDSDSQVDYFDVRFYSNVTINTKNLILKFHPEHEETKNREERSRQWEERAKERKKKSNERKGRYKKGQEIWYYFNHDHPRIPKGWYEAVILKSPSGKAIISSYNIKFWVDKKYDQEGNIIERKPIAMEKSVFKNQEDEVFKPKN